jgi:hypothetical protein
LVTSHIRPYGYLVGVKGFARHAGFADAAEVYGAARAS